jgi:hypothetical protein
MSTDDMIHELLSTSMRHLNDATDPDTPEACFRPYLLIGALAAQNAYLLDALVRRDPGDVAAVVAELRDLADDGEVLVSWVGEQLNARVDALQDHAAAEPAEEGDTHA